MKNIFKRFVILALVAVMLVSCIACKKNPTDQPEDTTTAENNRELQQFPAGDYVYKDSVSLLATNWNPHTYETNDDSYPIGFITSGLYDFIFNDALHPLDGKAPYAGYVIVPEMAASDPVDVTASVKKDHPEFGIPESADKGYAYTIDLNQNACWADGTKINADTYIYSMKQLLDPILKNYRSTDYMDGDFAIANAKNYFYQGTTNDMDNGIANGYTIADLVKGADGNYYTPDGDAMFVAVDFPLEWCSGNTLKDYVDAYGTKYFGLEKWDALVAKMDADGLVPLNDETNAMLSATTTTNPNWGETDADLFNYYAQRHTYEANYSFDKVGLYKSGDYQITLVLEKSLSGFYLFYNLTGNWIVYEPYYEAGKKQIGETDAWTNTYNSSVETTMSYGPYKMTSYIADQSMKFEKNEKWYGYSDGKHVYVDPEDDKLYPMYQTTAIECQVVAEAATRKLKFLKGQLMGYGLQTEDFDQYRGSDYCFVTPSETIFFFIFNGYMDAIKAREAAADFDQSKYDLETMTLISFRQAVAVTYDKEALCTAVSPSRSGGYGLIGTNYIYDPETGAKYRDSDQAKKALCDFYSVDVSKFDSLDAAVKSITGYDEAAAKELYTKAFNEALEKGFITDADKDGKSDQIIEITYASSATSSFITKTLDYLNLKMSEVLVGTPFEGKIMFKESAPLGDAWSENIKNGMADTVLGGWSGSALNPFSLSDLYVNPSRQYDAKWFNASTVDATMTINGEEITMNLKNWSDALNGTTVKVGDKEYCFGDGFVDVSVRLDILAMIEAKILMTYDYIPMLQDGSMALLSQQVYYVIEQYNPILGRGGIAYMKYNYNEEQWNAYIAEQGGELKY